jgi:Ca2+-binding EF-hand superfamily protein
MISPSSKQLLTKRNDFGREFEVSVHTHGTKNKSQNLALESRGNVTSDVPTKFQHDQNLWMIVTAPDESYQIPIEEDAAYSLDDMIREIKQKLNERGSFGIRGLARIFKIMDDKGDRKLDVDDFRWGLIDYGISITKEDAGLILERFDRNKDGSVDFNEFLVAMRGEINQFREVLIRKAYQKLDINGDGLVKLDDISKIYDASEHPEVLSGKKTAEDVYREFMKQWDT